MISFLKVVNFWFTPGIWCNQYMDSGIYSYALGFSQTLGEVLWRFYVITTLLPRHQQHTSYSRIRKPIWILLTFLSHRLSIYIYENCANFHTKGQVSWNDTTCTAFPHCKRHFQIAAQRVSLHRSNTECSCLSPSYISILSFPSSLLLCFI